MTIPTYVASGALASCTTILSFVAAGASATGLGADCTPGLPAGHTTNDILILVVQSANETITAPSGYTLITNGAQGTGTAGAAGSVGLAVFWKRDNGSETDPTVANVGDHQIAQIFAFRGCVTTGNPWGVTSGGASATVSTTVSTSSGGASATAHSKGAFNVHIVAHAIDSSAAQVTFTDITALQGYQEATGADVSTDSGVGGGFSLSYGIQPQDAALSGLSATLASASKKATLQFNLQPESYNTITPALPAGWAEGDIFILAVVSEKTSGLSNKYTSTPAGWTFISSSTIGNGARLGTLLWRRAVAGDAAPVLDGYGSFTAGAIFAFRGGITSGTPISFPSTSGSGTGTAVTKSSWTSTGADSLIAYLTLHNISSSSAQLSAQANASLTSVTELLDVSTTTGVGGGIAVTTGGLATAGSTGSFTATLAASTNWGSIGFELLSPPTPITGTSAVTEGADTATASSIENFTGTSAVTEGADTSVGSGVEDYRFDVPLTTISLLSGAQLYTLQIIPASGEPIPMEHMIDSKKLDADAYIQLFEITLSDKLTKIYLKLNHTGTWQGNTYEGFGIKMSGVANYADDQTSRPSLMLHNPEGIFSALVDQGLLENGSVTRIRILKADFDADLPIYRKQRWRITRVAGVSRASASITLELRDLLDGANFLIPPRMYLPPEFPMVSLS